MRDIDSTDLMRDNATIAHLVEAAIQAPNCGDALSGADDTASQNAPLTEPWQPRPVSPARVGLSRKAHARAFNDPSNYLG